MEREDLVISGSGSTSGGEYNAVRISGSGRVNGDIKCVDFICSGSSKVEGAIHSEKMVINGSTKVVGDVHSKDMIKVNGSSVIEGNVYHREFKINGSARVVGDTTGEHLYLKGNVKVEGDCEVEYAKLDGSFKIEGLLSADKIEVELNGRSYAKEIGGESITVQKIGSLSGFLDRFFKPLTKELIAEMIEGDAIHIEYTKAKVVRGNKVKIGPGCIIDLVEYKADVSIHEDALVKEKRKV
ncbi:polymer-forming cytoskeletal protein [Alkalihalobacillus sp. 1P02AB]|uniref:polymer-forming cytoskeletal protein n=1 Tax=Alkalihalobacillus sp. 1P02AB TaxID=3132260 RepID=UPI0039A6EB45